MHTQYPHYFFQNNTQQPLYYPAMPSSQTTVTVSQTPPAAVEGPSAESLLAFNSSWTPTTQKKTSRKRKENPSGQQEEPNKKKPRTKTASAKKQPIDLLDPELFTDPSQRYIAEVVRAIQKGDENKATLLLSDFSSKCSENINFFVGKYLNIEAFKHDTLLIVAVKYKRTGVITSLVEIRGANANIRDASYKTPDALVEAIKTKQKLVIRSFISKKCDVNRRISTGKVPLHFAIDTGDLEIVQILVQEGKAEIAIKGYNYRTNKVPPPIQYAEKLGFDEIAKYLKSANNPAQNPAILTSPSLSLNNNFAFYQSVPGYIATPPSNSNYISAPHNT